MSAKIMVEQRWSCRPNRMLQASRIGRSVPQGRNCGARRPPTNLVEAYG